MMDDAKVIRSDNKHPDKHWCLDSTMNRLLVLDMRSRNQTDTKDQVRLQYFIRPEDFPWYKPYGSQLTTLRTNWHIINPHSKAKYFYFHSLISCTYYFQMKFGQGELPPCFYLGLGWTLLISHQTLQQPALVNNNVIPCYS